MDNSIKRDGNGLHIVTSLRTSLWLLFLGSLLGCGTFEVQMEPAVGTVAARPLAETEVEVQEIGQEQAVVDSLTPATIEPETMTEAAASDSSAAELARAEQADSGTEARPTPSVDSTGTPKPRVVALPAPIYYINAEDSQIWRVEKDGVSLKQVTSEGSPVIDFDVSPKDGALVYVSDDQLIYNAVALGGRRKILMPAGDVIEQNPGLSEINSAVRRPRWAPDGSRIVYAKGGINLYLDPAIPRQEGVPEVWSVLDNDPLPDPVPDENEAIEFEGPQTWYSPLSWLPDGQSILIRAGYYGALGSFMAILDVEDGSLVELALPEEVPCCFNFRTWGQQSGQLLQAGSIPIVGSTGLWQIDPSTGESVVLIPGETAGEVHLFAHPIEVGDRVYGFHASAPSAGAAPLPYRPMAMVAVANDGSAEFDQLSQEHWVVGQADWLPDGSGIVIIDVAGNPGGGILEGVLRWLSSDGSPSLTLPAHGHSPQWGLLAGG